MAGRPTTTTRIPVELLEEFAFTCEDAAGKLRATALVLKARGIDDLYVFKDFSAAIDEIRSTISRVEQSRTKLISGSPLGPDSLTDRSVLKKKASRKKK